MTDLYVFLVAGGALGIVVVSIGWAYERWAERRKRRATVELFRSLDAYKKMSQAMAEFEVVVGTAFVGPLTRLADALRNMPKPAGTVQNPSDPSPRPRYTPEQARDIADWEAQR